VLVGLDPSTVGRLSLGVLAVPGVDKAKAGDPVRFTRLRSHGVFSTTRHPEESARFVAYLTSAAADQLLIEEASQLPYRRGLSGDPRLARSLRRWPTLSTYATYVERRRHLDPAPEIVASCDSIPDAYQS